MMTNPDQAEPGGEADVVDPDVEDRPSAAELEEAGQSALFGGDEPISVTGNPASEEEGSDTKAHSDAANESLPIASATAAASADEPYRVLARKYRPQTFSELIGQEPMVQTLANAIKRDRLAHAFLMTGVRGVGKTSTARLIAKSLNCVGPNGNGGPTIDPCGQCEPCQAIAEGRHIDVIEMDAASHTGVDDVREIIEAVRYAAVSARYKIYIIDEVHMLSRNAFNALLKTLEEPPAHVKFLFATTEVDKLPVTVLSRTQRFDLRRIPTARLREHFAEICKNEQVEADDDALQMIAAAAEGSVRDGLSILDQAIAHADLDGEGRVSAERVRDMLGLADKGAQRRVLQAMLEGDAPALLAGIDEQYALGVEPLALMRGLMGLVHHLALFQVSGDSGSGELAEEEAGLLREWAQRLSPPQMHRLWQLLLKGYDEVRLAPDPLVAAQMALLRALYASDMPDPGALAKKIDSIAQNPPLSAASSTGSAENTSSEAQAPAQNGTGVDAAGWAELVDRVEQAGLMHAASIMRMQIRVITLAPGHLVFARSPDFTDDVRGEIGGALKGVTGERWRLEEDSARLNDASETLVERAEAKKAAAQEAIMRHPLVEATMAAFPDAEFVEENSDPRRSNRRFG